MKLFFCIAYEAHIKMNETLTISNNRISVVEEGDIKREKTES